MRNLEFRIGFAMTEYKVGATLCGRPKKDPVWSPEIR